MSDSFTELNPGHGGAYMDETGVTYPDAPLLRKRPRVVVAGEGIDDIAPVGNAPPAEDAYGLTVRPVTRNGFPGDSVCLYDSVTLVTADSETTVVSYTVPSGKTFYLMGYLASGDLPARYVVLRDTYRCFVRRSTAADPNVELFFATAPISLAEGAVVSVNVIHYQPGLQGNFEATIVGYTV